MRLGVGFQVDRMPPGEHHPPDGRGHNRTEQNLGKFSRAGAPEFTARCIGRPDVKLNDEAREFEWVTVEQALAMKLNNPTRVLLEAVKSDPKFKIKG